MYEVFDSKGFVFVNRIFVNRILMNWVVMNGVIVKNYCEKLLWYLLSRIVGGVEFGDGLIEVG